MRVLQRVKGKLVREMGLAPALMLKVYFSCCPFSRSLVTLLLSITFLLHSSCSFFFFSPIFQLGTSYEKQGKINEAYKKLEDGWLSNGDKVPPAEFAKVNVSGFHLLNVQRYYVEI